MQMGLRQTEKGNILDESKHYFHIFLNKMCKNVIYKCKPKWNVTKFLKAKCLKQSLNRLEHLVQQ